MCKDKRELIQGFEATRAKVFLFMVQARADANLYFIMCYLETPNSDTSIDSLNLWIEVLLQLYNPLLTSITRNYSSLVSRTTNN
jgi:hypothetical protein